MDSYGQRNGRLPPSSEQKINFSTGTIAVLAGVLILGVGIGSAITSTTDGGQGNIASQQQLDMAVPDPEFCRQWGASAFVIDVEMYTTLNPSRYTSRASEVFKKNILPQFASLESPLRYI